MGILQALWKTLFPPDEAMDRSSPGGILPNMELMFPNRNVLRRPGRSEIERALKSVSPQDLPWITLSQSPLDYICITAAEGENLGLEYVCGTLDNYHRAVSPVISRPLALNVLIRFARGDRSWYEQFTWERLSVADIDLRKTPRAGYWRFGEDPAR